MFTRLKVNDSIEMRRNEWKKENDLNKLLRKEQRGSQKHMGETQTKKQENGQDEPRR